MTRHWFLTTNGTRFMIRVGNKGEIINIQGVLKDKFGSIELSTYGYDWEVFSATLGKGSNFAYWCGKDRWTKVKRASNPKKFRHMIMTKYHEGANIVTNGVKHPLSFSILLGEGSKMINHPLCGEQRGKIIVTCSLTMSHLKFLMFLWN